MNTNRIFSIISLILVFALLGVIPASAQAIKTPYTASLTNCAILDPGTSWTEGGIEHVRNIIYKQYIYSEEPRVVGFQYSTTNWNYNLKSGFGVIWGKFTHEVESGTWEGTFNGSINEYGLTSGNAIGKGYGDLDGFLVKTSFAEDFSVDLTGIPLDECPFASNTLTQYYVEGVHIDTQSQ